jgi:hypothetical protein
MLKAIAKRIVRILITLPLTLFILEVGVRIVAPQPVEDLAYEDIYTERYSPALNGNVMALVPGITRVKNNAEVHINNDGNRDYEYSHDKKEGVTRIAIVGSSVSFGFNLKLEDTYGKQLEKMLNEKSTGTKYEVLLFGRPGFKAKETYAYLTDVVLDYDPDLIIYDFVQNNYEDQSAEAFFSSQKQLANDSQNNGSNNSVSLLTIIRNNWWKIRNNITVRFIRTHFQLYLFSTNSIVSVLRELYPIEKEKAQNIEPLYPDTPEFKQKINNTESWISLMNQECLNKNIKFAILMHPYEMQLNKEGAAKWSAMGIKIPEDVLSLKTHLIMKAFSEEQGFYFINIVPALRGYTGSYGLFTEGDYGHYNVTAHKIIADFLAEEIFHILI